MKRKSICKYKYMNKKFSLLLLASTNFVSEKRRCLKDKDNLDINTGFLKVILTTKQPLHKVIQTKKNTKGLKFSKTTTYFEQNSTKWHLL